MSQHHRPWVTHGVTAGMCLLQCFRLDAISMLLIIVLTLGAPPGVTGTPDILLIAGAALVHTHHPSEAGRSSPHHQDPHCRL